MPGALVQSEYVNRVRARRDGLLQKCYSIFMYSWISIRGADHAEVIMRLERIWADTQLEFDGKIHRSYWNFTKF